MKRSAFPFVRGVYGRVRRCRSASRSQAAAQLRATLGRAIVAHHPLDLDAAGRKPRHRAL